MNTNSTEVKNEMGGTVGQGGTGDPPVAAGNLPGASPNPSDAAPQSKMCEALQPASPLKVSPSPSLTVSGSPAPQFIKTPEVYSRQGELLTPEHPDYAGILGIITRELSERFQNGETALAHFFAPPGQGGTVRQVSPSPSLTVSDPSPAASPNSPDAVPQPEICEAPQPNPPLKVSESPSLIVSDLASPPLAPPALAPAFAPPLPAEPAPSLPTSDLVRGTLDSFADQNSRIEPPARKHGGGRVSKVSLLPDSIREWVNESLLRNIPYYIIVEELEEKGFPDFNDMNICNWRRGGFERWLKEREDATDEQARRDLALAYARQSGCSLAQALCQASLGNLYQLACKLDMNALLKKIEDDPELFLKLNKESINLLKVDKGLSAREANKDKNKETPPGQKAIWPRRKGGLTLEERDAAEKRMRLFE